MRNLVVIYLLIAADSALENFHFLYSQYPDETEWRVWDISNAGRVLLLTGTMMMSKPWSRIERLIVFFWICMQGIDFVDWILNGNTRDQSLDWALFITVNLIILLTPKLIPKSWKN